MSLLYVAVILNLTDGENNPVSSGAATFTPSAILTDVPDGVIITQAPIQVPFNFGGSPSVRLLATDNSSPAPSGWAWNVSFSVNGSIAPYSFFVPAGPAPFTATSASPAVFTWTPTAAFTAAGLATLPNGTGVQLSGGSLPTGFSAATTYYVVGSSGSTFQLAATSGGSAIASTSTGSGNVTVTQYALSSLTPVSSTVTMAAFMPLPSGTLSAGQVPVFTGVGKASVATTPGVAVGTSPDQLPAAASGLVSTAGLTSLFAAIANRNNARCDIPVIGDSITAGNGATTWAATWIQQANRAVRAAHPTAVTGGGQGFIPLLNSGETTYTWPFTVTGSGFTPGLIGPVRGDANMTAACSFVWTAPAGTTSVQIMYYDNFNAGTFSYQVAAGAVTNVSTTATQKEILTASITITSGQTLTITWVSGNPVVDGIIHYAGDESSGITLHSCGHPGWDAGTGVHGWNQPRQANINWQQSFANGFPNTAALAIMLGVNDANVNNGNFTAAQFQANLSALITGLRGGATALANIPILLIITYQPFAAFADPGGWAAYVAAIRAVAAATAGTHVIDLAYRIPADPASGGGAYWVDGAHPNNLGSALVGEIISAGVGIE